MLNSVNTNLGAMVALQNLNRTNNELGVAQSRINTGLAIGTAKDNAAIWAIAQSQRADVQSLNAVVTSLQRGQSTIDVALSAGEAISDILNQMKEKAVAASEVGLSTASKTSLSDEYVALRSQISTIAANAEFDGVNLIGSTGTAGIKAIANADATSTIDVAKQNLSLTRASIAAMPANLSGTVNAASVATIQTAIADVGGALSKLGTGSRALDTHLNFVMSLQDTLRGGIGNLVDADLAKESARLQALQTKQQLGMQALSIANASTGALLSLFR